LNDRLQCEQIVLDCLMHFLQSQKEGCFLGFIKRKLPAIVWAGNKVGGRLSGHVTHFRSVGSEQ